MPAPMPTGSWWWSTTTSTRPTWIEVVWAICTRCDPRDDVQILNGCWSTTLDPMAYPPDRRNMNSRMVIDACTPWNRRQDWPATVRNSAGLEQAVREKFGDAAAGVVKGRGQSRRR